MKCWVHIRFSTLTTPINPAAGEPLSRSPSRADNKKLPSLALYTKQNARLSVLLTFA